MRIDVNGPSGTSSLAILTELAREARNQLPVLTPAELDTKWSVVSMHVAMQRARRRTLVRLSMAGIVATAAVVALSIPRLGRLPERAAAKAALSYDVEGGTVVEGGYLRESGSDAIKLRFTEGTELVLKPGTRARLRSVSSSGARIAIEHGTTSFRVTPRSEARWQVDVGPFLVTVKGTVFTVSWDAVSERFDLKLQHGEVSVTGPISTGELSVKAGQRLVVNLPKKETVITEEDDEEGQGRVGARSSDRAAPTEAPAAERPALVTGRPSGRNSASASGRVKSFAGQSWVEAVAAGQWDRVLAEVDHAGVRHTLARASSEELLALADAARYRRRTGLARSALLAERNRFPGSPSALDAAFLLGRLAEPRQGEIGDAVKWYDTYLAGAPAGTYASEALGRKMMATKQIRGSSAAESLAREYLRRFPAGPYAGAARALLFHP
ncbi:MAG TPA: FecR domain-containing protein [Polyangia bacterium]